MVELEAPDKNIELIDELILSLSDREIARGLGMIVGEFIDTAGTSNGLEHMPDNLLDRIIGPNAWYRAKFSENGIKSRIWEYRHLLAVNEHLNTIKIRHQGKVVYSADTWRYDFHQHRNQRFVKDSEWIAKIVMLTKKYSRRV